MTSATKMRPASAARETAEIATAVAVYRTARRVAPTPMSRDVSAPWTHTAATCSGTDFALPKPTNAALAMAIAARPTATPAARKNPSRPASAPPTHTAATSTGITFASTRWSLLSAASAPWKMFAAMVSVERPRVANPVPMIVGPARAVAARLMTARAVKMPPASISSAKSIPIAARPIGMTCAPTKRPTTARFARVFCPSAAMASVSSMRAVGTVPRIVGSARSAAMASVEMTRIARAVRTTVELATVTAALPTTGRAATTTIAPRSSVRWTRSAAKTTGMASASRRLRLSARSAVGTSRSAATVRAALVRTAPTALATAASARRNVVMRRATAPKTVSPVPKTVVPVRGAVVRATAVLAATRRPVRTSCARRTISAATIPGTTSAPTRRQTSASAAWTLATAAPPTTAPAVRIRLCRTVSVPSMLTAAILSGMASV